MEELTERMGKGLVDAIVAIVVAGFLIFMWHWFRGGYKYLAGILKERNVSRKRIRTQRKQEAQNVSDGVTALLDGMLAAGALNDAGYKHWKLKFQGIGLKDAGREISFGKPWYEPMVHSLHAMKNRLSGKRRLKRTEDKTTVIRMG